MVVLPVASKHGDPTLEDGGDDWSSDHVDRSGVNVAVRFVCVRSHKTGQGAGGKGHQDAGTELKEVTRKSHLFDPPYIVCVTLVCGLQSFPR